MAIASTDRLTQWRHAVTNTHEAVDPQPLPGNTRSKLDGRRVTGDAMDDFEAELEADLGRGIDGQPGALVDAAWLDPARLTGPKWSYRDNENKIGGIILGYRKKRGIGSTDNRHILTVAGSRGGKGVSLIVPNLLKYEGSVLAIDPKGELARITARARRQMGQKVVILNPFPRKGQDPGGSFNPLAELNRDDPNILDDAGAIADALIIPHERDPHWTDSARILVKALILYALDMDKPEERTLVTVWQLLSLKHPAVTDLARKMEGPSRAALFKLLQGCTGKFDDAVAAVGANLGQMNSRELASIMSTALTQLEFLDSRAMARVLQTSDFRLSDLKTGKATLYLCLPAMRMGTHARWLRVIINLALMAFEKTEFENKIPVLMVLDEFAALERMKSIETAAGLMAGFGVKLWVVLQDLTQIKRHYSESWETFVGNAGVATFFSNSDQTTLEYVSNKLGQTSVQLKQQSDLSQQQLLSGQVGAREDVRVQRLSATHELERNLDRDRLRILVLAAGQAPVILKRFVYHQDKQFDGLYDK